MVRIMIKGGVWKNTEDEILKAAVMKYGKMQWARVASLLSRKTAKQCKARWFEWLDPSIKKTDWNREEEEKLLHLAKLMPNQWRTIAPIVGRTAAQCLEHYERLLDMAQEKESGEGGGITADDAGEARRLRPGEIDPTPETKPARPDPIDMDEDEKEMLQEARARLANTRGKKAKRKAREKQLEEARRLATLQKRRELKAAGIEHKPKIRKRKTVDYGREIPFQITAPAGFYDVGEEREATKKARMDPQFNVEFMHKLEEKRRSAEEEQEKKKDERKLQRMMKANLPQQIMKVAELNDPISVRKRMPLSLPSPQVTDAELEDIVKMSSAGAAASGSGGSSGLIGEYQDRPSATPLRTPSQASGTDVIMQEARNMIALTAAQTPLLGGQNATLEEGTGFGGSKPRSSQMKTPSALSTMMTPMGGGTPGPHTDVRMTPGTGLKGGQVGATPGVTPFRTPFRDQLGLNKGEDSDFTPTAGSKQAKEIARRAKEDLAAKLAGLPAPQYTYEIKPPDVKDDDNLDGTIIEEDQAEADRRKEAIALAEKEKQWRQRSEVLKRNLPRPINPPASDGTLNDSSDPGDVVYSVVQALVGVDAVKYPVAAGAEGGGGAKKKSRKRSAAGVSTTLSEAEAVARVPPATEEELMNAQLLIDEEIAEGGPPPSKEDFAKAWETLHKDWTFLPDAGTHGSLSSASAKSQTHALMHEFHNIRQTVVKLAARAAKAEARLVVTQGGYGKRAASVITSIAEGYTALDESSIEHACFYKLAGDENMAAQRRLAEAQGALAAEEKAEMDLQNEYADLLEALESAEEEERKAKAEKREAKRKAEEEKAAKGVVICEKGPVLKKQKVAADSTSNGEVNGASDVVNENTNGAVEPTNKETAESTTNSDVVEESASASMEDATTQAEANTGDGGPTATQTATPTVVPDESNANDKNEGDKEVVVEEVVAMEEEET